MDENNLPEVAKGGSFFELNLFEIKTDCIAEICRLQFGGNYLERV